jgi:hypothetical protein
MGGIHNLGLSNAYLHGLLSSSRQMEDAPLLCALLEGSGGGLRRRGWSEGDGKSVMKEGGGPRLGRWREPFQVAAHCCTCTPLARPVSKPAGGDTVDIGGHTRRSEPEK